MKQKKKDYTLGPDEALIVFRPDEVVLIVPRTGQGKDFVSAAAGVYSFIRPLTKEQMAMLKRWAM